MSDAGSLRRAAGVALLCGAAAFVGACASTGAVPRPFPTPDRPSVRPSPGTPAPVAPPVPFDGLAIADTALGLQGIPYRLGGANPAGFDCSGLVQYVLSRHGIAAPRIVRDQFALGEPVKDEIRPGDLIFFAVGSRRPSHVGIAVGGDRFVHAPATGSAVRLDALSAPYWRDRYAGTRRVAALPPAAELATGTEQPAEAPLQQGQ